MNILDYILIHFTQRELELYRQRNFENKTYDELKKTLGVPRERVRQLEERLNKKIEELSHSIKITIDITK